MFGCGVWICILSGGFWSAMEDASGTLPRSCASGAPTPRGRGAGPLLPLMRPLSLYTLDMGRDRQAKRVRARLLGWLQPPEAAGRLVQRPARASCRRSMFKFAGATRSAGTSGSQLVERSGYREDPGAGPIRPRFRPKERLPAEGGFPCKRPRGRHRGTSQWNVASRASFHRLDGQGRGRDPVGRRDGAVCLCRNLSASQGRATGRSPLREGRGIGMGQGVESSGSGLGASLGFWYLLKVGVGSRLEGIIEHVCLCVKG